MALGLGQSRGNLAPHPSGLKSSLVLLPGSWAGPAEVAMGQQMCPRSCGAVSSPVPAWGTGGGSGTCPCPSVTGRAGQGGGSPQKCPEPPKVPGAPSSTSALPRTLPRAQQRDVKSHHTNYANRINYSCYSEGSPESSLAL